MRPTAYQLEPEVAGGFGDATVIDTSMTPNLVTRLEYEFDGWLGDELVEFITVHLVTARVRDAVVDAGLTGIRFAPVAVSRSERFDELHRGDLPEWVWMQVIGAPARDDAWIGARQLLTVSERMLAVLQRFPLAQCRVVPVESSGLPEAPASGYDSW
ncbi:hypothetical protein [Cellulomonas pakistanensis]|uniref:Uncharacterized protein n=1 Tax=Cellulomonas pakistanensis TaxID=992287 RepID=A0A919PDM5_9CELL|nr:hypothetical protein [Cellulomonas pakistanensis]GIG36257.1 hypothetical protein Cpa01nite_16380 [Cellulomonas pakistanensis]